MSHKKRWACTKPDGDGCDGNHKMSKPREFWVHSNQPIIRDQPWQCPEGEVIHVREVIRGDMYREHTIYSMERAHARIHSDICHRGLCVAECQELQGWLREFEIPEGTTSE